MKSLHIFLQANDYVCYADVPTSPYKAIILSEVIMGKPIKMFNDAPRLTEVRSAALSARVCT